MVMVDIMMMVKNVGGLGKKFKIVIYIYKAIFRSVSNKHMKQKTAYEIGVRLVGSEMCIRDRCRNVQNLAPTKRLT